MRGYGLNLQFARNVVYYSNDWDYATRAQSEDRVHRLGQEQDVHIYDLACYGSLDMRILQCLKRKEHLLENIKRALDKSENRRAQALHDFFFDVNRKEDGGGENIS